MIVAQGPGALLHVRLQQEERLPVAHVTFVQDLQLLANEGFGVREELAPDRVGELVEELTVAAQVADREHRRAHRHVRPPHVDGVVDGAGRTSERHPGVPQPVLQPLRHRGDVRRELVAIDDEQVDVRVDRHLPAGIAPDGHHAERLADLTPLREEALLGHLEEPAHHPIREIGVGLVHDAAGLRSLVQNAQMLTDLLEVGAHGRRDRTVAILLGVDLLQETVDLRGRHQRAPTGGSSDSFRRASRVRPRPPFR